jgi:histidyl-tRNA synthetase
MTPTVARMIAAREKHYKKPIKWFSIAQFFRYEKPQKGRLREFLQFNCDLVGDASAEADAELCALVIDLFRVFGLDKESIVLRLSDRTAWAEFLSNSGIEASRLTELLQIIDKLEREDPRTTQDNLARLGVSMEQVHAFIASGSNATPRIAAVCAELDARGFQGYYEVDLTIVRGLAYYTGLVFEVFDRARKFRALAGGGRYDHLISLLSDGAADLPAVGVGIGDVVLGEVLDATPGCAELFARKQSEFSKIDVYFVLADPTRRPELLRTVQQIRDRGFRADYALGGGKVGKQFQTAEQLGASHACVIGAEWPQVKIKHLAARTEQTVSADNLPGELSRLLAATPDS